MKRNVRYTENFTDGTSGLSRAVGCSRTLFGTAREISFTSTLYRIYELGRGEPSNAGHQR